MSRIDGTVLESLAKKIAEKVFASRVPGAALEVADPEFTQAITTLNTDSTFTTLYNTVSEDSDKKDLRAKIRDLVLTTEGEVSNIKQGFANDKKTYKYDKPSYELEIGAKGIQQIALKTATNGLSVTPLPGDKFKLTIDTTQYKEPSKTIEFTGKYKDRAIEFSVGLEEHSPAQLNGNINDEGKYSVSLEEGWTITDQQITDFNKINDRIFDLAKTPDGNKTTLTFTKRQGGKELTKAETYDFDIAFAGRTKKQKISVAPKAAPAEEGEAAKNGTPWYKQVTPRLGIVGTVVAAAIAFFGVNKDQENAWIPIATAISALVGGGALVKWLWPSEKKPAAAEQAQS